MANPLVGQVIPMGNPMVADTPPQYANPTPVRPANSNWLVDALGRDFNRLLGSVTNGVMVMELRA